MTNVSGSWPIGQQDNYFLARFTTGVFHKTETNIHLNGTYFNSGDKEGIRFPFCTFAARTTCPCCTLYKFYRLYAVKL